VHIPRERDESEFGTSISVVGTRAEAVGSLSVRSATERSDEAALIRAAQGGDTEAFEQLVRSYDQQVLRMAFNLLRSHEDARDIYQEAFLRVYRSLPKFRFDCTFHTWLYRIVANLCLDQIRKRKVRREEAPAVETSGGEVDRFQFVAEQRADVDPQRQLMSAEVSSRVNEVLARLTARERLVFEMRHFQGMKLRSIGEALGVTEEAAKNCLFRATQKMRAALGDFV
jgi:RNA polymerase sigma-70 factor (ECF subfamily)